MSGIIDVEYKHIGNTVGELIANPFSITTQTRNVDKEGSEMKTGIYDSSMLCWRANIPESERKEEPRRW